MAAVSDLFQVLVDKLQGSLETFVSMLPNLLVASVVVAGARFVAGWVRNLVCQLLYKISDNRPISNLLGTVSRFAVVAVAIFVALGLLDLDKTVTSLLAGVGVVGLALGFAFQDIAANFMSGFMMALRRPFTVGDLVEVGGKRGKVEAIALRATELQTLDGLSVMIPNKDVFQSPIINFTRTSTRRLDIPVGVAYSDDLERVRDKARSAVEGLSHRALDRDIDILFDEFGDSSINLTVRVWLDRSDEMTYRSVRSEAIIAIKKSFDANDITIPFPIRTLDFGAEAVGGARIDAMKLRVASDDISSSSQDGIAQSG